MLFLFLQTLFVFWQQMVGQKSESRRICFFGMHIFIHFYLYIRWSNFIRISLLPDFISPPIFGVSCFRLQFAVLFLLGQIVCFYVSNVSIEFVLLSSSGIPAIEYWISVVSPMWVSHSLVLRLYSPHYFSHIYPHPSWFDILRCCWVFLLLLTPFVKMLQ